MFIKEHSNQIIGQVSLLVQQLNADEYARPLPVFSDNSVGKHVRHIVEFYQCMFEGVQTGLVDYDNRVRVIQLETDINYVLNVISDISFQTIELNDSTLFTNVCYGKFSQQVQTTTFCELVYNIEHAVHHLAIIKIGLLQSFPHVVIPENLGVADSTVKYQQQKMVVK